MSERLDTAKTTIVRLTGEIDLGNVADVRREVLEAGSADGVVVSLGALDYIDSAGIGLLDDLASVFAAKGWPLRVVCPPDATCRRVLELGAPGLPLHDAVD